MIHGASLRLCPWYRRVSLLVIVAFVTLIPIQAPHLVHHLFEPTEVENECLFAVNGERSSVFETRPVALVAAADVPTHWPIASTPTPPSVAPAAASGRAPPAPTS